MMRQLIICVFLLCNLTPVGARGQMSVKQAWKWQNKIGEIRGYVEDASKYGLTFSPVLSFYGRYYYDNSIPEEERLKRTEKYIRKVVGVPRHSRGERLLRISWLMSMLS